MLLAASSTLAFAQQSFIYTYDAAGQLHRVLDSSGTQIEYVYDAVGNIVAVERTTVASGPHVLGFSPQEGGVGTVVTIQGRDFGTGPRDNVVTFGGTAGIVVAVNEARTNLVALVPVGAVDGLIGLTVGGAGSMSEEAFDVLDAPVVASIAPTYVFPGETVDVMVTGSNLLGSVFSFEPALVQPPLSSMTLSLTDTSATVRIIVSPNARAETFVLVATHDGGSSALFSSLANTLRVLDPAADDDFDNLTNAQERAAGTNAYRADTDGDGFPDGLELAAATNALVAESVPSLGRTTEAVSPVFSVLARTDLRELAGPAPPSEAVSVPFSLLARTDLRELAGPAPPSEAVSIAFSLLARTDLRTLAVPAPGSDAVSPMFSIQTP